MDNLGGKSINHFFQFVKRQHSGPDWDTPTLVLDEETLLTQEGLNEAQVEILREELVKREMLPAAKTIITFPAKATWRNQDADVPVTLTGEAGKGENGREYFTIEGSETAIPKDEVTLVAEAAATPEPAKRTRKVPAPELTPNP